MGGPRGAPRSAGRPSVQSLRPLAQGTALYPAPVRTCTRGVGLAGQELAGRRSSTAGAHMATTLGPCRHHTRHEPLPLGTGFVPHTGPASYGPFASLRS